MVEREEKKVRPAQSPLALYVEVVELLASFSTPVGWLCVVGCDEIARLAPDAREGVSIFV